MFFFLAVCDNYTDLCNTKMGLIYSSTAWTTNYFQKYKLIKYVETRVITDRKQIKYKQVEVQVVEHVSLMQVSVLY